MKVTGHEVTGVILAPVTSFTFFFNAWMVRYYRRRRLRRPARRLRRFPMRRTRSKKYRKSRLPRQNRLITRTFKKVTIASAVVQYMTAQGEASSFAVKISDNADAAAMASNFDQYRINWAKWRFEPHSHRNSTLEDSSAVNNNANVATAGPPAIAAYIDRDDITTSLQSCNDAVQRGGRMAFWPKPLTFKWRPRVTPMYYKDAVSTAYGPSSKPVWIDCNDQAVPHYGLKSYFAYPHDTSSSRTSVAVYHYSLHVTFSVTFRDRLPFALVGNI